MNFDIRSFLKMNGIEPMDLLTIEEGRAKLPEEINPIATYYGFYKERKPKRISIADIEGFYYEKEGINSNIIHIMDFFFDSQGDGYHTRSLGLLKYTAEDAIHKIDFDREKIVVDEMGDNKYSISMNGLHRYTVLRVLYLSEYIKIKGDKEKEKALKEKYTIPVDVRELDEIKTYCKYLLMTAPCGIVDVKREYDGDNWCYTGRLEIIKENDKRTIIFSDEELLQYVRYNAETINQNIRLFKTAYTTCPSFKKFMETHCSDFLDLKQLEEDELEH